MEGNAGCLSLSFSLSLSQDVSWREMAAISLSRDGSTTCFSHLEQRNKKVNLLPCSLHLNALWLMNLVYQLAVLILSTGRVPNLATQHSTLQKKNIHQKTMIKQ